MKCPHCTVEFHAEAERNEVGKDVDGTWVVTGYECPNPKCRRLSLELSRQVIESLSSFGAIKYLDGYFFRPKGGARPVPAEVPADIAADFTEAAVVLADSAKASAALSRRCLQSVLRDPNAGAVTHSTLYKEIEEVTKANKLPSYALDELHYVREVGNAAAHPLTSGQTGQVYAVQPGEAEVLLDVVETLFDEYYVKPAASAARLAQWQQNKP